MCGTNKSDEAGNKSEEVANESNGSEHVYKALNDSIRNYEGSMICPKKCADVLSEYLENNGWDTNVEKGLRGLWSKIVCSY